MTNDQLIAIAQSHLADMPELSGEPWANPDTLSTTKIVGAVIVYFEGDRYPKKIMVALEKESGNFIMSGLVPRE
jgi:hypothetical protein